MKKKVKKKKPKTVTQLKKKLDALVSKYIRLSNADDNGYTRCFTCNTPNHYKKHQCGHYVSRAVLATRFDPENLRVQCYGCNVMQQGRAVDFRENLVKELGEKKVKELEQRRHLTMKLDTSWYETKIAHYKPLVDELLLGVPS